MSNPDIDCLANQVVQAERNQIAAGSADLDDLSRMPMDGRARRIRNSAGAHYSDAREAAARGDSAAAQRHRRSGDYATAQLARYLDQN